jgi:hypothetical protein
MGERRGHAPALTELRVTKSSSRQELLALRVFGLPGIVSFSYKPISDLGSRAFVVESESEEHRSRASRKARSNTSVLSCVAGGIRRAIPKSREALRMAKRKHAVTWDFSSFLYSSSPRRTNSLVSSAMASGAARMTSFISIDVPIFSAGKPAFVKVPAPSDHKTVSTNSQAVVVLFHLERRSTLHRQLALA